MVEALGMWVECMGDIETVLMLDCKHQTSKARKYRVLHEMGEFQAAYTEAVSYMIEYIPPAFLHAQVTKTAPSKSKKPPFLPIVVVNL